MTAPRPGRSWRSLLDDQGQVIGRSQALAGGMTKAAWEHRITRGAWRSPVRGIAVAHSGEVTLAQALWVAVLRGGPRARLSGDAALVRHGMSLTRLPTIDVAVPAGGHATDVTVKVGDRALAITGHRVSGLEQWASPLPGPPALTPHAAVLHAAAWAPSDQAAEWRIAAVVQQGRSAPVLIRAALAQMPTLPRRALIRAVLDDVELGAHAASELAYLRFCRKHGLPLPDALQVKVRANGMRYLDARYERQRLTVELDGRHHMRVEQWEADTLRTLNLIATHRDERVVRLTAGNLRHDGAQVAALLRRVLS